MTRPLRVFLITGEYPPMQGGVGDYTSLLARHLALRGHRVAVATRALGRPAGAPGEVISTASRLGVGATRGRPPSHPPAPASLPGLDDNPKTSAPANPEIWRCVERWTYRAFLDLRHHLQTWDADVVNLQCQAAAFDMHPAANLAPLLLQRGGRPRFVATFHDLRVPYLFPKAGPLRRLAVLLLAALSDATITTNRDDRLQLDRSFLGRRSPRRTIPIGSNIPRCEEPFDRAEYRARIGAAPDDLVLAYFGFLNRRKGVELLFEALAALLQKGVPVRLVMIGGTAGDSDPANRAHEKEILALAGRLCLGDRVFWTGFVDKPAVSAHLQASDLCVLPFLEGASYRNGTLLAAIEHGMPILTTSPPGSSAVELGGTEELSPLRNEGNALLVPAGDLSALVAAIERARSEPALLERLRSGARLLAPQFAWEHIAEQTESTYKEALGLL